MPRLKLKNDSESFTHPFAIKGQPQNSPQAMSPFTADSDVSENNYSLWLRNRNVDRSILNKTKEVSFVSGKRSFSPIIKEFSPFIQTPCASIKTTFNRSSRTASKRNRCGFRASSTFIGEDEPEVNMSSVKKDVSKSNKSSVTKDFPNVNMSSVNEDESNVNKSSVNEDDPKVNKSSVKKDEPNMNKSSVNEDIHNVNKSSVNELLKSEHFVTENSLGAKCVNRRNSTIVISPNDDSPIDVTSANITNKENCSPNSNKNESNIDVAMMPSAKEKSLVEKFVSFKVDEVLSSESLLSSNSSYKSTSSIDSTTTDEVNLSPALKKSPFVKRVSTRTKVRRLNWWERERIVYKPRKSGTFTIAGISSPAYYFKDEYLQSKKEARQKARRTQQKKLRKRLSVHVSLPSESQINDNPNIPVNNPSENTEFLIDCISEQKNFVYHSVGDDRSRDRKSLSVCKALNQKSFSAGILVIPPLMEKETQHVCVDTMVFNILSGKLSVEIHRTLNILEEGDFFFVPQGNTYSLKNLRREEARLSFFQLKG